MWRSLSHRWGSLDGSGAAPADGLRRPSLRAVCSYRQSPCDFHASHHPQAVSEGTGGCHGGEGHSHRGQLCPLAAEWPRTGQSLRLRLLIWKTGMIPEHLPRRALVGTLSYWAQRIENCLARRKCQQLFSLFLEVRGLRLGVRALFSFMRSG